VKTDDLISLLSTGVEPVDARLPARRFLAALAVGTLISLVLTTGILRLNSALWPETAEAMFWVREVYCTVLGALGLMLVVRLARPGRGIGFVPVGIAAVVMAMWMLALAALAAVPPQSRTQLILGHTAAACPFLIAFVAAPLFVAFIWAARGLAPTRLRWAGAASGFAAGSIGALVYTLHCPELAAPFLGVWYLLGMLIPTAAGALLGPRLLCW
jgi:hypothetical protein